MRRCGVALVLVAACAPPPVLTRAPEDIAIAAPADAAVTLLDAESAQSAANGPCDDAETVATATAAPTAQDLERARIDFDRGVRLYAQGDYAGALATFHSAYVLAPNGEVLYNVATCLERVGQACEARKAFQRYLRGLAPTHARRADVQRRIDELGKKLQSP